MTPNWLRRWADGKLKADIARQAKLLHGYRSHVATQGLELVAAEANLRAAEAKLKTQQGIWDAQREVLEKTIADLRRTNDELVDDMAVLCTDLAESRAEANRLEREADGFAKGLSAVALERGKDLERIRSLEEELGRQVKRNLELEWDLQRADADHAQLSGELQTVGARLKTFEHAEALADETRAKRYFDGLGD